MLVRVLRANGTPVLSTAPTVQGSALGYTETINSPNTTEDWKRLVIERSNVVAPEYRILLFPFRSGETLPTTTFTGNDLSVTLGGQADSYTFEPRFGNVGGQSVTMNEFTLTRGTSNLLDYRNQIEPTNVRGPAGIADLLPAAPTGLTATALAETQVRLNWTDNTTGDIHWLVERSPAGGQNWTPLASTLLPNSTSFTDVTAMLSTGYDYRVRSITVDGLSDFASVSIVTPAGIGDGIPGWWRYLHFGNGLAIIPGVTGPTDDPDGDGSSNQTEFLSGTVPVDPVSSFRITRIEAIGLNFQITFTAVAGKLYRVERCGDLATGSWATVADDLSTSGWEIVTTVPPNLLGHSGFYRARVKITE